MHPADIFCRCDPALTPPQAAIASALRDRHVDRVVPIVMVVGAGRGPLVSAALSAARTAGEVVTIYAVEKNPNALVTLHSRQRREVEWADVRIVDSDMREWRTDARADILVSELLG